MPTVTTTTTTTTADGTTTTTTTTVTAEEGVPPVGEDAPAPPAPAAADPLPHPSGMYLRWDPASETAAQGEQAWAELLQRYGELPPVREPTPRVGSSAPPPLVASLSFS